MLLKIFIYLLVLISTFAIHTFATPALELVNERQLPNCITAGVECPPDSKTNCCHSLVCIEVNLNEGAFKCVAV
ncbi:19492_t:CDS:2 [Dentiscutata erythropus]|uniref:19492_t:CDS:1 n=1 Tax=Dentiscutata erythropus TaxID=1348616 RepID=A0A9N9NW90_9GLOM|nr:19492_t:CDS:2 [Dentiscutata erythropus]